MIQLEKGMEKRLIMKVKTWGTRGSVPVSAPDKVKVGGNTTCLQVISNCLPTGMALAIDSGSGFVPMSENLLKDGVMEIAILYTHWHPDHTQGKPLAPHTHIPQARIKMWGPKEHGVGPKEVFSDMMKSPYFPVDFQTIRHRFKIQNLEHIGTQVLLFHPKGGASLIPVHSFEAQDQSGDQVSFGGGRYPINECLVIRMYKTTHPEYAVSYRFEERSTGKIFVFLTDHENSDGIPKNLLRHVQGADLLIQDCQYSRQQFDNGFAGFGHGTPDYCAKLANTANVKLIGITHHHPRASDTDVQARYNELLQALKAEGSNVEGALCKDYDLFEV